MLSLFIFILQSFFSSFTLPVCEKFVSGDEAQVLMKIKVPTNFVERSFADIFRAMNTRGVKCHNCVHSVFCHDGAVVLCFADMRITVSFL